MSDDQLIRNCAPTLAGIKVGNLFNTKRKEGESPKTIIARWRAVLGAKGLSIVCLKVTPEYLLIYVYRPKSLKMALSHPEARRILCHCGYCRDCDNIECQIDHLVERLSRYDTFPHEIGLFLGYPPEDVDGFIRNKGRGCKCVGCWKVYGDADDAQKQFNRFRRCTALYCKRHRDGAELDELIVGEA